MFKIPAKQINPLRFRSWNDLVFDEIGNQKVKSESIESYKSLMAVGDHDDISDLD